MGRQIAIRTAPDDRRLFEEHVFSLGGAFLAATHSRSTPTVLAETAGVVQKFEGCFWIHLAKESEAVRLRRVGSMSYWMVDQIAAPVVEYTFPRLDDRGVGDGRLFYRTGHYEGQEWTPRSSEFLSFADAIFKWVRREFSRPERSGPYVGPSARRAAGR